MGARNGYQVPPARRAVRDLLREALSAAREGPLTPQALAERLGLSRGEVEALIGALLSHGYVREVGAAQCAACPLKGCPLRGAVGSVRVYELTERGRRLIGAQA